MPAIGLPIERVFSEPTCAGTSVVGFNSTPTTGTKLILMVCCVGLFNKIVRTVTDTQGNTWEILGSSGGGGGGTPDFTVSWAECQVRNALVAGVDTFTMTFANATSISCTIWLHEVSGLIATRSLDQFASQPNGVAVTSSVTTSTLTQPDEYVQACSISDAGTSGTHGSGFVDVTTPVSTVVPGISCEYAIVAATTAVTATYTWNASGHVVGFIMTFKGASDESEDFSARRGGVRR